VWVAHLGDKMAVGIEKQFKANVRRHEVYNAILNDALTKEEISALVEGSTPSSIRTVCDDMINKGHVVSRKSYNKLIKRWVVKYSAVIGKPVKYRTFEEIAAEHEAYVRRNSPAMKKGKFDDLIAKNPALRVIKKIDQKVIKDTKNKTKSYYRGIASSFNLI
jgi:hypothetical protein